MITQIQEILRQVDIFGQSISLSFRQREKYKTSFGGLLSMCMIATIISFFYSNILSFFDMTSVTSNESLIFENTPELLRLDPSIFMFAIQIEQQDFINNPFFNVTIEQRHYHRYDNGTQYKYPSQYIDLVQCTQNHFQTIFEKYNISFEEQYNKLNLSNFLCPNPNNINSLNLTIGGILIKQLSLKLLNSNPLYMGKYNKNNIINLGTDYSSNQNIYNCTIFQNFHQELYIDKQIVYLLISNSESIVIYSLKFLYTFSWKPTCKSAEQIKEATQNLGSFRFQLYQINYLINPQKPRHYIQPYLSTDTFYSFVPNAMFIQSDIFFRFKEINSDKGILMYPDIEKEKFPYREFGDQREQISINYLTQNNYGAFYFSRSPYKYIIQRDFMRLDELLSYLGGFTQFMIVIVGIFVSLYNREHLKISMANDLYEFDMSLKKLNVKSNNFQNFISKAQQKLIIQKRQSNKKIDSIGQSPDMCLNIDKQNDGIDNEQYENQIIQKKILNTNQTVPDRPMITQMKNQVSKYFDQFCQYMKKKYKVKIGLRMIIASFLQCDCLKNDDGIVVEKAINQVNKELDIEYILKQLHEIQKFKKILLDNNQIGIFNFSQKPIIALYRSLQNIFKRYYFPNQEIKIQLSCKKFLPRSILHGVFNSGPYFDRLQRSLLVLIFCTIHSCPNKYLSESFLFTQYRLIQISMTYKGGIYYNLNQNKDWKQNKKLFQKIPNPFLNLLKKYLTISEPQKKLETESKKDSLEQGIQKPQAIGRKKLLLEGGSVSTSLTHY